MNIVAKQGTRLALVADDADLDSPICKTQVYNMETGKLGNPCMLYRLVANGGWTVVDTLEPFDRSKAAKAAKSRIDWADHPYHEIHERIVDHYKSKIQRVMSQSIRGIDEAVATAKRKYDAEQDATKATGDTPKMTAAQRAAQAAVEAHITVNSKNLTELMHQLLADGIVSAGHATAEDVGGKMLWGLGEELTSVDWATWEPGWAKAADLTRGGGLARLLETAKTTVKDMDANTLRWLGNVLADGLDAGSSSVEIARAMDEVVDNPDRALLIANTEVSRAMSEATVDTYAANDIEQWEWLSEQDERTCDFCLDKDGQQYDVGGDDPRPPEHPRCRCVVLPVVAEPTQEEMDAANGTGGDDTEEADEEVDTEKSLAKEWSDEDHPRDEHGRFLGGGADTENDAVAQGLATNVKEAIASKDSDKIYDTLNDYNDHASELRREAGREYDDDKRIEQLENAAQLHDDAVQALAELGDHFASGGAPDSEIEQRATEAVEAARQASAELRDAEQQRLGVRFGDNSDHPDGRFGLTEGANTELSATSDQLGRDVRNGQTTNEEAQQTHTEISETHAKEADAYQTRADAARAAGDAKHADELEALAKVNEKASELHEKAADAHANAGKEGTDKYAPERATASAIRLTSEARIAADNAAQDAKMEIAIEARETSNFQSAVGPSALLGTTYTFNSMDEAVDHFQSIGVLVYKESLESIGVTPEHLATVAGAVTDMEAKYPGVQESLTTISGANAPRDAKTAVASITMGEDNISSLTIYPEAVRMSDPEYVRSLVGDAPAFSTAALGLREAYQHEMGHVVQNMTGSNAKEDDQFGAAMKLIVPKSGYNDREWQGSPHVEALRAAGYVTGRGTLDKKAITRDLTEYAAESNLEFHAEAVAMFNNPERFAQLSDTAQQNLLTYQSALNTAAQQNVLKAKRTDLFADRTVVIVDDFGIKADDVVEQSDKAENGQPEG